MLGQEKRHPDKDKIKLLEGMQDQVKDMMKLLTEMFTFIKKTKGGACQLADEGAQYNKTNADHFDDLDQKYLHGTLHINIEKESLRKEVGVIDKANFNDINVDLLCQALSACYQMDIKPVHLKACRRISVKGTISITFHNTSWLHLYAVSHKNEI